MRMPPHLLAAMAAGVFAETATVTASRHAGGQKPRAVDKARRAKRRRAKAARKRNRR